MREGSGRRVNDHKRRVCGLSLSQFATKQRRKEDMKEEIILATLLLFLLFKFSLGPLARSVSGL